MAIPRRSFLAGSLAALAGIFTRPLFGGDNGIPPSMRFHHLPTIDEAIGRPLDPAILRDIGVSRPVGGAAIDPSGAWTLGWRLWANHTRRSFQNKDIGWIRISRAPRADGDVDFTIHQEVVNADALSQRQDAEVRCAAGPLPVLRRFHLEVACVDAARCLRDDLGYAIDGAWDGDRLVTRCAGRERAIPLADPPVPHWLVADAVQRGVCEAGPFTALDQLLRPRPGHRLLPSSLPAVDPGEGEQRAVLQLGSGMAPMEWWRDARGRVATAVCNTMAWILDPEAEAATRRLIEQLIQGWGYYEY